MVINDALGRPYSLCSFCTGFALTAFSIANSAKRIAIVRLGAVPVFGWRPSIWKDHFQPEGLAVRTRRYWIPLCSMEVQQVPEPKSCFYRSWISVVLLRNNWLFCLQNATVETFSFWNSDRAVIKLGHTAQIPTVPPMVLTYSQMQNRPL